MYFQNLIKKAGNRHFLSLTGNFSMSVLSFLTFALLIRKMPNQEEMGNWIFFLTVIGLIDTVRTGFLHSGLIKFYSGAGKLGEKYAGAGWVIALLITLGVVIINIVCLIVFRSNTDVVWDLVLKYTSISLILGLPSNFAGWMLQARNRFDIILMLRFLGQGSFIIAIIILIALNKLNLFNLLYVSLASGALSSLICLLAGWTHMGSIRFVDKEHIKTLYHYGKYSTGTVMSSNLLRSSDTFIIKIFLGPAALAIYSIPQRLMEVIEIPLRSFIMTAMPEMSTQINQNNMQAVVPIMKRYAGLLTIVFIPVSLMAILLADVAIWMVAGTDYLNSEAANIFRIYMFTAVLFPLERFMGITLDIINKPKLNLIKVIIMLGINVFGNLLALYFYKSLYAITFSGILTLVTGVLFGHFMLKKYLDYKLNDILKVGLSELRSAWDKIKTARW